MWSSLKVWYWHSVQEEEHSIPIFLNVSSVFLWANRDNVCRLHTYTACITLLKLQILAQLLNYLFIIDLICSFFTKWVLSRTHARTHLRRWNWAVRVEFAWFTNELVSRVFRNRISTGTELARLTVKRNSHEGYTNDYWEQSRASPFRMSTGIDGPRTSRGENELLNCS